MEGESNLGFENEERRKVSQVSIGGGGGFLSVDAGDMNSRTYVYEPDKSLQRMTIEALPSEDNYRNPSDIAEYRPNLDELMKGEVVAKVEAEPEDVEVKSGKVIKFGWLEGVLMRCLLNIWGTMLFLRLTWVVGQAGIISGILCITLCNVVTAISAISMSAISTNGQIAGGGVYYMISRSLGPALGGSIGLMFTMANTISVATYTIGFSESLLDLLADVVPGWNGILVTTDECSVAGCRNMDVRIIGGPCLLLFLIIAFAGMDWVTRIQKTLLVLLLFAQLDMFAGSFIDIDFGTCYVDNLDDGYQQVTQEQRHAYGYTGWSLETANENLNDQYIKGPMNSDPSKPSSFMEVYGVFFTAVTGIVAGANLSGDLKDPADAIPKGTLLAIAVTYVTYIYFAIQTGFIFKQSASGVLVEYQMHGSHTSNFTNGAWVNETFPDLPVLPPRWDNCSELANLDRDTLHEYFKNMSDIYNTTNYYDQWTPSSLEKGTVSTCLHGSAMDQMTMTYTSFTGFLRYAGGFSASLSSAIASLVGAPRVLQAVGKDDIYPGVKFFAFGYTANNDPYRGYILVFVVAFAFTMWAGLNIVSVIASNFFLAAYALMNLSCFHSSITKAPSWRPSYKWYNPWVSLLGALMCVVIMFCLDLIWASGTLVMLILLGAYILYANPETNWGSSVQAQVFVTAVKAVHTLTETPDHVKTYRPKILVLTGNPAHRPAMADFANLITKNSSLLICGHVLNDPAPVNLFKIREDVQSWLRDHGIKGFYTVNQSSSFEEGAKNCISMSGLGKMSPNMVLMGFKSNWKSQLEATSEYINTMYCSFDQKLSFGILRIKDGFDFSSEIVEEQLIVKDVPIRDGDHSDDEHPANPNELALKPKTRKVSTAVYRGAGGLPLENKTMANIQMFQGKKTGNIDVWWLYDDGGLSLLLPYILTTRKHFKGCKLRIFTLANRPDQLDKETRQMATMLAKFRIDYSDVNVIPDVTKKADASVKAEFDKLVEGCNIDPAELQAEREKTNRHLRLAELLRQYSSDSEMVVMTLPLPRRGHTKPALYMAWLDIMTKNLPPILLVRGNQQSVLTFYS